MKKLLFLFITVSFVLGCDDDTTNKSSPIDLSTCFSPEFGLTEAEQFFFNIRIGELTVNLDSNITTRNLGYSVNEGTKTVFVYRHFLENNFDVIDDEVEIRILFEIDTKLNSFDISSIQDFVDSKCVYSECGIALQTISGNIYGSRNSDGSWFVDANLKVQRFNKEKLVVISDIFKL